jgi:hypothetical protein
MRKALLGAGLALVMVVGAACQPVKEGVPDQKDVLILGDSIAGGLGCWVFGEMGQIGGGPNPNCGGDAQPGITAVNGWLGACTISGGWVHLYNHTALNTPNCYNYADIWKPLIDRHNPRLVILWTSGWEIVNRWSQLPAGCDPGNIALSPGCLPPADEQWGNVADPGALVNAQQAYRSNLHNAINVLSSRGAKVLVLNAPYVSPLLPAPPSLTILPYEVGPGLPALDAVWYEPYVLPVDPIPAHPTTVFAPSKIKVDNFNVTLDAIRNNDYGGGTGNVQFFDVWRYLSPKLTPLNLPALDSRQYSQVVCAYPNSEQSILTCPTSLVNARYGVDGGHITPEGYNLIVEPVLMPKVHELLGK